MTTYSGRKFDPMQMTPGDVYIEDIAHALSLLCRGGGQLTYFYSVGQHSLNCAAEAKARGWSKRQQLACLLHLCQFQMCRIGFCSITKHLISVKFKKFFRPAHKKCMA